MANMRLHLKKILTFEGMNKMKDWFKGLRNQVKLAVYNPQNFDEIVGFTASKINIFSLLLLTIVVVSILFVLLLSWTPLGRLFFATTVHSTDKTELINQQIRIDSLTAKVDAQDRYLLDLKKVLFGQVEIDTLQTIKEDVQIDVSKIKDGATKAEKKIAENVKADQYTTVNKQESDVVHFMSPLRGKVSQKFHSKNHQAIDVVATKDAYFTSCLAGTVVYTDYSSKDGYVLVIAHGNHFLSIYKHAKSLLKHRGDRVHAGDMIGIVGNTGTHSSGPHLHFELWLNQQAVDPTKYMVFEN